MPELTHAQVVEMFGYDSATGGLFWKIRPSNRIASGDRAGAVASNGRCYISVSGKRYLAHRLVWLHQRGEWPAENIAPRNGDYLDTRIENLVEETATETVLKGRVRSNSKSGVKGVSWDSSRKLWAVHAYREYKAVMVGRFKELSDAIKCKQNADVGIFPSEADIAHSKNLKRVNAQSRRLWANLIKVYGADHGWCSLAEFYNDVGNQPGVNYVLVPVCASSPIGPGNFKWQAPEFDRSTRAGRIAAGKDVYGRNYSRYRDKQLRRSFGIGVAEYDAKSEEQNGVCAICSQPETAMRRDRILPLSVDHNHRTGAIRGLLCHSCNIGIGSLADSPDRLRSAASYLDKWNETKPLPDNVVQLKGR
jgi:hypothetical protein